MTIHITLPSAVEWSFYLVGVVTGIAMTIAFAHGAWKAMKRRKELEEGKDEQS